MKRKFHFMIIMAILLISCSEQPEFKNLFDPGTDLNPMAGQLQLTQLTDSQVRLQWQENNDIVGNYRIERKINSGNYVFLAIVDDNVFQYIDTELLTTNTYCYRVFGVNGENETDPISNSIQTVFAPITNFQTEQQNLTTSYLTWQHDCDYEEGYILERSFVEGKGYPVRKDIVPKKLHKGKVALSNDSVSTNSLNRDGFEVITELPPNSNSYYDIDLIPNHNYEYRLTAFTEYNSVTSDTLEIAMDFPAPTNFTIEQLNVHVFDLSWNDESEGEDGFIIERKIDDGEYSIIAELGENEEFYQDDINYRNTFAFVYYLLYAFYGNESSEIVEIDNEIIFHAVLNLNYEIQSINTINLTWQDINEDEDGFRVEKKVKEQYDWIEIGTVTDTFYMDTSAEINADIQYRVKAYCGNNETNYVETDIIDNSIPAPSNLIYTNLTISSIQLDWQDNSNGEDGFKIDKKVINLYDWTEIGTTSETTFIDNNAEINEDIQYRVKAYSGVYESIYIVTDIIENTIPAPLDFLYEIINLYEIEILWSYTLAGIDGFVLSRKVGNGSWDDEYLTFSADTYSYTESGLQVGESYYYRVRAYYDEYYSNFSEELLYTTTPEGMIYVQGGEFEMGDHYAPEGDDDELPVHTVSLDDFCIGKYEVTHTHYIEFLNDFGVGSNGSYNGTELIDMDDPECAIAHNGSNFYFAGSSYASSVECPVIEVTWYGAVVYCYWRSESEGLTPCYDLSDWSCDFTNSNTYRLPTEAEWEYAARGGINWGDDYRYSGCHQESDLPDYAWYNSNAEEHTHEVGTTEYSNQLTIFDLSGNVWEWCWDILSGTYYQECYDQGTVYNPTGPEDGAFKVIRGGSWGSIASGCRVANRSDFSPFISDYNCGFRFIRTFE